MGSSWLFVDSGSSKYFGLVVWWVWVVGFRVSDGFSFKKKNDVRCCCLICALHPLSCVASFVLFNKRYIRVGRSGREEKRGGRKNILIILCLFFFKIIFYRVNS